MKVLKVLKDEIKEYEKLKIISHAISVRNKIEIFERKYGFTFEEFEEEIKTKKKENFQKWDDYIEWKAYIKTLKELEKKSKEIENVRDIAIT